MAPGSFPTSVDFDAFAGPADAGAPAQRFVPGINARLLLDTLECEGRLVWRTPLPCPLLEVRFVARNATAGNRLSAGSR